MSSPDYGAKLDIGRLIYRISWSASKYCCWMPSLTYYPQDRSLASRLQDSWRPGNPEWNLGSIPRRRGAALTWWIDVIEIVGSCSESQHHHQKLWTVLSEGWYRDNELRKEEWRLMKNTRAGLFSMMKTCVLVARFWSVYHRICYIWTKKKIGHLELNMLNWSNRKSVPQTKTLYESNESETACFTYYFCKTQQYWSNPLVDWIFKRIEGSQIEKAGNEQDSKCRFILLFISTKRLLTSTYSGHRYTWMASTWPIEFDGNFKNRFMYTNEQRIKVCESV